MNKPQIFRRVVKYFSIAAIATLLFFGYKRITYKSPEQIKFELDLKSTSLEGKVQEFPIEGRDHVDSGAVITYKTNPPTSGSHYTIAQAWGVYEKEIADGSAVHGLEHGGIWISYKDISNEEKSILENIGNKNSGSVIVSPRSANDAKIAVASWGRYMKLDMVDEVLIQKYIDTYKNQSPEKLAK